MKFLILAALASYAQAFPAVADPLDPRALIADALDGRGLKNLNEEPNSGFFPNLVFNAQEQYVDVSPGSGHEFIAPAQTDLRGPCPGLNAAANHGFMSRTGVVSFTDTTTGLTQAYGFGPEFGAILFVFSVLNSGSIIDMKWSIGGPFPTTDLGLLGKALGISNSHIKYEGDSSVARGDAYLHNGDAHSLNIPNFSSLYHTANQKGEFNFTIMRAHSARNHYYSISHNPYYFSGPIFFVPPGAHQFVLTFMSNHSASNIQGFLTKDVLKSFFSVVEHSNGQLQWIPGHDRIPNNWYRRPISNTYGVIPFFGDFARTIAANPKLAQIGGNTGKVNSFTGVNVGDLTGGVFNAKNLLQGNNLACFAFEATLAVLPEATNKILAGLGPFFSLANSIMGPTYQKLGCPQLGKFDQGLFGKYPGFSFKEPLQPPQPF